MKFLPTESVTFKTKLKEDEIISRLSQILEPEKFIRSGLLGSSNTKPYEGKITGNNFSIKRIINYRNSFLPRILGTVEKDIQGNSIKVKMRLQIFVIIFIIVWCSGAFMGLFFITKNVIANKGFDPWFFMPIGMLLLVYVLIIAAFKYESRKAKNDLKTLFEAEMLEV